MPRISTKLSLEKAKRCKNNGQISVVGETMLLLSLSNLNEGQKRRRLEIISATAKANTKKIAHKPNSRF